MESRLHGVPLSAAKMAPKAASSYNKISGIRAPVTVDEYEFDYSVSLKSRMNKSSSSSYYSGSEVESDGFVSGEDEFESISEMPYVTDQDEEVLEETHFMKEYAFSEASVGKSSGGIVQERSKSNEHGFSRPSLKSPDEGFASQESGSFSGNAVFRPFVRNSDERISNVNDSDDSRPLLSDSGDEVVEEKDYVLNNRDSRPFVAVTDEEVSENEPIPVLDIRMPIVRKLHIPIARISWDSDDDTQTSLEDEDFSGIVRVASIEVLHRVNSAPRVRMLEADEEDEDESQAENIVEMEFVEDLVISSNLLGSKDEKEHIGMDETVISADMIIDKGPDVNIEARANSLVVNEEYNDISEAEKNENLMQFDEEIQEIGVVDEWGKCVDLVDHREPTDLDVGDDDQSEAENMVEMEFVKDMVSSSNVLGPKDEKKRIDVEDTVISTDMTVYSGPNVNTEARANSLVVNEECIDISEAEQNGDLVHLDEEIQEIDVIDERRKCVDLIDHREPTDLDEGDDDESEAENMVEMEFVKDLVSSTNVLGPKDENEHIDVEDTVISADMTVDSGPNVNTEARANSLAVNEECNDISEAEQNGDLVHLDEEIQEIDVIDERCVDLVDHREPTELGCPCGAVKLTEPEVTELGSSSNFGAASLDDWDDNISDTGLGDSRAINQDIESEKEMDQTAESFSSIAAQENRSVYECIDIKEVPTDECPKFTELPEALTESVQVDISDSLSKDASLTVISSGYVFEGTKFDQETKKEAENSGQLPGEAEHSTFHTKTKAEMVAEMEREKDSTSLSGKEIDGQIVTESDEGVDIDAGISSNRQIIENLSLESGSVDMSSIFCSTRPITEARNPIVLTPTSANGELEEVLSEREEKQLEKIQQIRVKYLRLLHRLGYSPEDSSVASKVLYQMTVAEARSSSQTLHFDSARKAAMELEEQKKDLDFQLSILVIGKTGVGKSATINSIFRERKTVIDAFEPATTCVKEIIGMIDGVEVKVFDTPGLGTSVIDQSINRKVLSSIKKVMQKSPPDVVLYVDRLDTQISNLNDLPVLKSVTSILGSSLWRKYIVALTHATSIPADGPDGYPLSYDVFVAHRSRVIQELISRSTGELMLMNPGSIVPVSLVENHPFADKNGHGESWRSQLLFLCYSMKILSEVSSVVRENNPMNQKKMFGLQIRSPSLSYLLSLLLQTNGHPKLDNDQSGDSDFQLDYSSDSDQEVDVEYDNLPPFKPLKKSQIAKLSWDQKKAYFEENSETYMEGFVEQETSSPETIAVPLPEMALARSLFTYCFLEPSSQLLTRPVLDSHGWDNDSGYDGVLIEDKIDSMHHFPAVISLQLIRDKKEFNIQLHSSVSAKYKDNISTMAGVDIQTLGKKLTYILIGETKIKNFRKNKTAAGESITFLGQNMISGLMIKDHFLVGKQLTLVGNAGFVCSQDDAAYGVNLEICRRDKDYRTDQHQTSLGLCVMRRKDDLIYACNLHSQYSVGRSSKLNVSAGLNSKLSGQICIKTTSSDQVQIAILALLPIAKAIFKKIFPESTED